MPEPTIDTAALDFKLEISEPISKVFEAASRIVEKGIEAGMQRYDKMDEGQRKRLDEVLVRSVERGDEVLEAIHRFVFRQGAKQ